MNWMVVSVLASIAGASAPLLMVESAPGARGMPALARQRRRRAPWTFLAFIGGAIITLFAQWENPLQRTIGVASQLAIALIGFVWCARILTRPDRAVHETRD